MDKIANELIGTYGAETFLYDIDDSEFTTGTVIGEAFKAAGYDAARTTINNNNWWNLTVAQLVTQLAPK